MGEGSGPAKKVGETRGGKERGGEATEILGFKTTKRSITDCDLDSACSGTWRCPTTRELWPRNRSTAS